MTPTSDAIASAGTILLVEHSGFTRRLVRGMLRSLGYTRVAEAASAHAALRHLRTHSVDLILLDWRLPHLNGADLLVRLRSGDNPRTAITPVIVVSAHVDLALLHRAAELDARSVIAKPFSLSVLQTHIEAALGREPSRNWTKSADEPASVDMTHIADSERTPDDTGQPTEIVYL